MSQHVLSKTQFPVKLCEACGESLYGTRGKRTFGTMHRECIERLLTTAETGGRKK